MAWSFELNIDFTFCARHALVWQQFLLYFDNKEFRVINYNFVTTRVLQLTEWDAYLHPDSINPKFVKNLRIAMKLIKFICILSTGKAIMDVIILALFSHLQGYILLYLMTMKILLIEIRFLLLFQDM